MSSIVKGKLSPDLKDWSYIDGKTFINWTCEGKKTDRKDVCVLIYINSSGEYFGYVHTGDMAYIMYMIYIIWPTFWSHFTLGDLNYYVVTSENKCKILIVFILYCKTLLLLLRWDTCKVRLFWPTCQTTNHSSFCSASRSRGVEMSPQ